MITEILPRKTKNQSPSPERRRKGRERREKGEQTQEKDVGNETDPKTPQETVKSKPETRGREGTGEEAERKEEHKAETRGGKPKETKGLLNQPSPDPTGGPSPKPEPCSKPKPEPKPTDPRIQNPNPKSKPNQDREIIN